MRCQIPNHQKARVTPLSAKNPYMGGLVNHPVKFYIYLKTKILHIPKLIVANSAILPCETIYKLAQWKIYYYSIEINLFKVTTSDYLSFLNF